MAKYKIAHVSMQGIDLILVPLEAQFGRQGPKQQAQSTSQLQRLARMAGLRGTVVPVWSAEDGGLRFIADPDLHPVLRTLTQDYIYASINRELDTQEQAAAEPAPVVSASPRPAGQGPAGQGRGRSSSGTGTGTGADPNPTQHRLRLVTLMFTDMVGSTKLKQTLGDPAAMALIRWHHDKVRTLLAEFPGGEEISTAGDSFFLMFEAPSEAVRFALRLQALLRAGTGPGGGRPAIQDRIGIHIGEVFFEDQGMPGKVRDCHGINVDFCARIMSLAEGNQILMTRFVLDNARQMLKGRTIEGVGELSFVHHGRYQFKGIDEPVEVGEVGEVGMACLTPPPDTAKACRSPEQRGAQRETDRPGADAVRAATEAARAQRAEAEVQRLRAELARLRGER